MPGDETDRRRFIAAAGSLTAGLAGCLRFVSGGGESTTADSAPADGAGDDPRTATATPGRTATAADAGGETATDAPTGAATDTPTEAATDTPTETPADTPTETPTDTPTPEPAQGISTPLAAWPSVKGDSLNRGDGSDRSGHPIDGSVVWRHNTTSGAIDSSPVVTGDKVVYGSPDGNVYCLSATDGSVEWTYEVGTAVETTPAVGDGRVYTTLGSEGDTFGALSLADGSVQWTVEDPGWGSPTYRDGTVYVVCQSTMCVLDAESGDRLMKSGGFGLKFIAPAVDGERLYVPGRDATVVAIEVGTGARAWEASTDSGVRSQVVAGDGLVYAIDEDSTVYAFDAATGKEQWRLSGESSSGPMYSSPAYVDGELYAPLSKATYRLDAATGEQQWKTEGEYAFRPPAVGGDVVYLAGLGVLAVLNRASGTVRTEIDLPGAPFGAPAVSDGTVFTGAREWLVALS